MPLHVLLPWGAQMLSLMDGVAGDALLPTLKVTQPCGLNMMIVPGCGPAHVGHHDLQNAVALAGLCLAAAGQGTDLLDKTCN